MQKFASAAEICTFFKEKEKQKNVNFFLEACKFLNYIGVTVLHTKHCG